MRAVLLIWTKPSDPHETRNLAREQPEIVQRLHALLATQPEAQPIR
jgi:hypothetical protein